jgi:hypothetical protein
MRNNVKRPTMKTATRSVARAGGKRPAMKAAIRPSTSGVPSRPSRPSGGRKRLVGRRPR